MKAIVYETFGPPEVLHLKEIAKPAPKDNEVLIRVHAASVNYGDLIARNFANTTPAEFHMPLLFWLMSRFSFGLGKPTNPILGAEFSGQVEAAGAAVTRFKPGDQVFGFRGLSMGAYAEYLTMPEDGCLADKPARLSYAEAAAVSYGGIMALNLLGKANLQPGSKVLVIGASGGIGSAAVQLAKARFGAEVTGVCGAPRLEYVKALGADQVIDYKAKDFTKNGQTYDLIFDVLGMSSFAACRGSLKPAGIYLRASFKLRELLQMLATSRSRGKRVICAIAPGSRQDLLAVKELIDAGVFTAIIDRRFPMEQAAEAHRYCETGQKKASVVIMLGTA